MFLAIYALPCCHNGLQLYEVFNLTGSSINSKREVGSSHFVCYVETFPKREHESWGIEDVLSSHFPRQLLCHNISGCKNKTMSILVQVGIEECLFQLVHPLLSLKAYSKL